MAAHDLQVSRREWQQAAVDHLAGAGEELLVAVHQLAADRDHAGIVRPVSLRQLMASHDNRRDQLRQGVRRRTIHVRDP